MMIRDDIDEIGLIIEWNVSRCFSQTYRVCLEL